MPSLIDVIRQGGESVPTDPEFPHAPSEWTRQQAADLARAEQLVPGKDHWEAIRALQQYFFRHQDTPVNVHELHDALEEKFHRQGGMRYLYQLFPAGPVAQGCRLAGLKAPAGTVDRGFGSVV